MITCYYFAMNEQVKPKRQYRRITAKTVAEYKATELAEGNGAAAVRRLEPTRLSERSRAFRIRSKKNDESPEVFIDNQMQQIGIDAIQRIGKLVNSENEAIAGKMSTYVVDHIRGQATKKSINLTGKINIQSVID